MDRLYQYPMMDGSFFPGIEDYYGDQEETSFLKETDISKTTVIVNCIQMALFYFIWNCNKIKLLIFIIIVVRVTTYMSLTMWS